MGWEPFKRDVSWLSHGKYLPKKKRESERERGKKRDIPYKIRVLKIVFRPSEREEPKTENTADSVQESGEERVGRQGKARDKTRETSAVKTASW